MPSPAPLRLSDRQLAIVKSLATPLSSLQRAVYLERVAALLRGREQLEDAEVHKVGRIAQAELLRPGVEIDGRR
jgi:hypothetical protein